MGHWIVTVAIVAAVGMGIAVSIDPVLDTDEPGRTSSSTEASPAFGDLEAALMRLDQVILSDETPRDLNMGWSDLREDTLSLSRDMLRDPARVDGEGMLNRITSFWDTYAPTSDLGPWLPEWGEFEQSYQYLLSETTDRTRVDADRRLANQG